FERFAYACRADAFGASRHLGIGSIRLCTRSLPLARRLTHGITLFPGLVGYRRQVPLVGMHSDVRHITHRDLSTSCSIAHQNYVKSLKHYLSNRAGVIGYASNYPRSSPLM